MEEDARGTNVTDRWCCVEVNAPETESIFVRHSTTMHVIITIRSAIIVVYAIL